MGEIFRQERPAAPLDFNGERFTTAISGGIEHEHLHRYALARDFCRGLDVADVASGEGYGSAILSQVARTVVGVEIDATAYQHAKNSYIRPNLSYVLGDARAIPLQDSSVDVLTSFETLEHFFEHERFLDEAKRLLRSDGLIIISTPDRDVYSPAGQPPNFYHVRELSQREFIETLRGKFKYVEVFTQRTVNGSLIARLNTEDSEIRGELLTFERRGPDFVEGSDGLPRGMYIIACASDQPLPKRLAQTSVYIDTRDIDETHAQLIRIRNELNVTRQDLSHQVAKERQWSLDLTELNSNLASARALLVERDAALAASQSTKCAHRAELLEREAALHELRSIEQQLRVDHQVLAEQIGAARLESAQRDATFLEMKDRCQHLEAQINALTARLAEADRSIAGLRESEKRLTEECKAATAAAAATRTEAEAQMDAARSEWRVVEGSMRDELRQSFIDTATADAVASEREAAIRELRQMQQKLVADNRISAEQLLSYSADAERARILISELQDTGARAQDEIMYITSALQTMRGELSGQIQRSGILESAVATKEQEIAELRMTLEFQERFLENAQASGRSLFLGGRPILAAARRASRRRNWARAEALYKRVLQLRPDWAAIWVQYGHATKEQGDLVAAIGAYRMAATLEARDEDALVHLGHVLKRMGMIDEARTTLQKAYSLAPHRTDLRDDVLSLGGDPQKTVRELVCGSGAIGTKPRGKTGGIKFRAALRRAETAMSAGKWDIAAAHYQKALLCEKSDSIAWERLGDALWEAGDSARAEGAYLQSLIFQPRNISLRQRLMENIGAIANEEPTIAADKIDEPNDSILPPLLAAPSDRRVDNLAPMKHLQAVGEDEYLTIGDDAQFSVEGFPGGFPTGKTLVKLTLQWAQPALRPVLYVWGGQAGDDLSIFALPTIVSGQEAEVTVDLPDIVAALRLDPTDGIGVSFKGFRISFGAPIQEDAPAPVSTGEFILTPLQHMRKLEGGDFLTTGQDPQFSLTTRDRSLPSAWTLISISTARVDPVLRPVLYVWGGSGGNDLFTFPFPVIAAAGVSKILVRFPSNVTSIRLDPVDDAGVRFRIDSISFSDASTDGNLFAPYPSDARVTDYESWVSLYDTLQPEDESAIRRHIDRLEYRPTISVVMPVYNPDPRYFRRALDTVIQQLYPDWELCVADDASTDPEIRLILGEYVARDPRIKVVYREQNGHISAASNSAISLVTGEFVALMDHDDELPAHALYMLAVELNDHPNADIIYSDEDKIDSAGRRHDPHFKTDWNIDLFYAQNMIAHLGVYRTTLVRAAGGFRVGFEGSQDYDFTLRVLPLTTSNRIRHIPFVLYHWRIATGVSTFSTDNPSNSVHTAHRALREYFSAMEPGAEVLPIAAFPSWWRIKRAIPADCPQVTLIIPTRDRVSLLRNCVDGILNATAYPKIDIIIVDNESTEPQTLAYFQEIAADARVQILKVGGNFNFSALNNVAAKLAHGDIIGFMNNDIEVTAPAWLEEMVSQVIVPGVGAVGAKLLYDGGNIQHAGVTLGVYGVAGHGHRHFPAEAIGYFGRPQLQQELSAVTAAVMLMPRRVFEQVGGYDEVNLPVSYNDVDLCLRVREAGYRIVYTPFAVLRHLESASRGADSTPEKFDRHQQERAYMEQRWRSVLRCDPFYSVNLSLADESFRIAFPPRSVKPWLVEPAADRWSRHQQFRFERKFETDINLLRTMAKQTAVVVVASAPFETLVSLANSLPVVTNLPGRIIIVDTSSVQDGAGFSAAMRSFDRIGSAVSIAVVRDEAQEINVARACNIGARAATNARYLTILTTDCVLSPGWFDYLLKGFTSYPQRTVVVSRVFLPDGNIEIPVSLFEDSYQGTMKSIDSFGQLPVAASASPDTIALEPVVQHGYAWGGGAVFGESEALLSDNGKIFDELFYTAGMEEDLSWRLAARQIGVLVTSGSAITLRDARSQAITRLWAYCHDYHWLNRKWRDTPKPELIEFVCPFHRGDLLIGIQVASQARRMGFQIRLHVAEDLLPWVNDFAPDFPVESLPVAVPSAEGTALALIQSYMHVIQRPDASPIIARSHPSRGLDATGRNLVEAMVA